jgi:molybdopterin adenylyltransferase
VIELSGRENKFIVSVLIASDRASSGEREDECLPVFRSLLTEAGFQISKTDVCSDDSREIQEALALIIEEEPDLVFISGGTGCGPRDNTPDVVEKLLDKRTPGVDEAIRRFSQKKSKYAIYSRSVSGLAGKTFLVSLPGSPKAVTEILEFLLPTIEHPLKLIANQIADCASEMADND